MLMLMLLCEFVGVLFFLWISIYSFCRRCSRCRLPYNCVYLCVLFEFQRSTHTHTHTPFHYCQVYYIIHWQCRWAWANATSCIILSLISFPLSSLLYGVNWIEKKMYNEQLDCLISTRSLIWWFKHHIFIPSILFYSIQQYIPRSIRSSPNLLINTGLKNKTKTKPKTTITITT